VISGQPIGSFRGCCDAKAKNHCGSSCEYAFHCLQPGRRCEWTANSTQKHDFAGASSATYNFFITGWLSRSRRTSQNTSRP
jgi:hypothetical protein